ncbi:ATP-binding protein [Candidatus Woesearchaeota archaeon]|nr:ATP-binding protein [Candidatus Woesearchaeota archaeon]
MIKGQVIGGEAGRIIARIKSNNDMELGELLISDVGANKALLQVYDLSYGSQISQQNLELISGLKLEENTDMELFDAHLRNYKLALLKNVVTIQGNAARLSKLLPNFFSEVREVTKDDLIFLTKPENPLFVGKLRSGSKILDVDIFLEGDKVLAHHILIPATTGRGKSNLTSCMLWEAVDKDYCGMLVLDPHDEYYGRNGLGLKDHPKKENIVYYTPRNVPPGGKTLKINLEIIKPQHFQGSVDWSGPQMEALNAYYKKYSKEWIEAIILEKPLEVKFGEGTLGVVKRRMLQLLDLEFDGSQLTCHGVFDLRAGETTINDIVRELEQGKVVIVDTSHFAGSVEILIGSLIATEILHKYRYYKMAGQLDMKPVISIVLEEAPRVLGKEVLEKGSNIFATIAREGRKFKVGLTAITQLPSLIPRQILANMNTKIILGIEMAPERQAIIESASQDLSTDNRNIASLDRGEAIISSNFVPFAIPIKVPRFEDLVKLKKLDNLANVKRTFQGIG